MAALIIFNTLGPEGRNLVLDVTDDAETLGNMLASGRWPAVSRRGSGHVCRINPQAVAYVAVDPRGDADHDHAADEDAERPADERVPSTPAKTIMGGVLDERW